jgi:phosphohistidine phosphatase
LKRLFLLRHAKTHPAEPGEEDHDRTLMARGRDDAARMARHLRARGHVPERVLVSTAARTRQTAELALADLSPAPAVEMLDTLYLAPMVRLLAIVHAAPAQAASMMLIGHNPGLEDLLCHLAAHMPAGGIEKFPTCALAVLDFPVRHWSQLHKKEGAMADYVTPRDY